MHVNIYMHMYIC